MSTIMRHHNRVVWRRITLRGVAMALGLLGWGPPALQAAPFAYLTNSSGIAVFDTATNSVVATVPTEHYGPVVHPAGTFVYVVNYFDETVSVVDTATNNVVAAVPVPPGPLSLAVHPAGTFVYVAHEDRVTVIDTVTNRVVTSLAVSGTFDTFERGIAVHPAGTFVYVSNEFNESISVIATATNAVVATVPTATRPAGITVHPAGHLVYAVNTGFAFGPGTAALGGHNLSVIDAVSNSVVTTVPIGGLPYGVAVHPAGTFVYVTNQSADTVSVIATSTHALVATVPVGSFQRGIAVHPAGTFIYVSTFTGLAIIDAATHTVMTTVPALGGGFEFIGPRFPGVSLTLNGTAFKPGDSLALTATTCSGDRTGPVDAYLELRLPDGTVRFAQVDGSFTTERRALVSRWTVEPLRRGIVRHAFSGADPTGSYAWRAYFTEPGTSNVVGLVAQARFTVGP